MYHKHFSLNEAPFSITPDPRFVYLTERHRDGLAHLLYGLGQEGSGGFVVFTGEVGTGKTTLCRLALEQLPKLTDVALVLNPSLNPLELLETVCEELKLDVSAARGSMKQLLDLLNAQLLAAHAGGRRVVLMLDEAQNLSADSLEQIRLLTNLETATQKLLQIILLGQPELNTMLARPELRQLAQRVTARYHLSPLTESESAGYIVHRLSVAGCERMIFEPSALKALHRLSGGIPRLLNVLADHALLAGFSANASTISAATVKKAAVELWPQRRAASGKIWLALFAGALLLALVAGVGWRWLQQVSATVVSAPPNIATPAAPESVRSGQLTESDIVTAWLRENGVQPTPERIARALRCPARLTENVRCLRGVGSPAFFRTVQLSLLRKTDAGWSQTRAAEFRGTYLALYRLPEGVPDVFGLGYAGAGVPELSELLAKQDGGVSKQRIFGPRMSERVIALQRKLEIKADGVVGPETWVALLPVDDQASAAQP
jgi:general secretion pathway protein A